MLPSCLTARGITKSVMSTDSSSLNALMYFGDNDDKTIDFDAHNALPHEKLRDVPDMILGVCNRHFPPPALPLPRYLPVLLLLLLLLLHPLLLPL